MQTNTMFMSLATFILGSLALSVPGHAELPKADVNFADTAAAAAKPAEAAAPATTLPKPWKDMNAKERGKYMKTVVTPKMKVVFQSFDKKLFKTFKCETCHGKDPQERKFKMPGPDVHPLPPTPAAFEAMLKKKPTWPKWTKFMSEQVQPEMAALLGVATFDPRKPEAGGFSCQACHTLMKE